MYYLKAAKADIKCAIVGVAFPSKPSNTFKQIYTLELVLGNVKNVYHDYCHP